MNLKITYYNYLFFNLKNNAKLFIKYFLIQWAKFMFTYRFLLVLLILPYQNFGMVQLPKSPTKNNPSKQQLGIFETNNTKTEYYPKQKDFSNYFHDFQKTIKKSLKWIHKNIINSIIIRYGSLIAMSQIPTISPTIKFYSFLGSTLYDACYWKAQREIVCSDGSIFYEALDVDDNSESDSDSKDNNKPPKSALGSFNSPTFKKHGIGYFGTTGLIVYGLTRGYFTAPF